MFAVLTTHGHVDDGEPPHATVGHRLGHPSFNRGDELPWNRPAHNLVVENETLAARKRLDCERGDGELPVAARLLFVFALGCGWRGDGLAVGDHDRFHVDRYPKFARQAF